VGHFAIPLDGNTNADYFVDNKMCVGSVGRMVVAPGQSAEIALCAADGLAVRSNNPNVIENPIRERPGSGGRFLTIKPKAGVTSGGAYIDFGVLNPDGWSWAPGSPWPGSVLVNVEPRATKPAAEGLVRLSTPSLALNSHDTPVPYKLGSTQTIGRGTTAEDVVSIAAAKGRLKHLVFSCHGYVSHSDGTITDSTISIGAGLNRANVGLFSKLKHTMAGGVIWAGACAIGNDNDTNMKRAAESGCFFVAPILFMAPKPGAPKPPEHHIDMYRRFAPKVFSPFGYLIAWDVFVKDNAGKLGLKIIGS
jgi:hypothetical protein